jgi:hypothetical protein
MSSPMRTQNTSPVFRRIRRWVWFSDDGICERIKLSCSFSDSLLQSPILKDTGFSSGRRSLGQDLLS